MAFGVAGTQCSTNPSKGWDEWSLGAPQMLSQKYGVSCFATKGARLLSLMLSYTVINALSEAIIWHNDLHEIFLVDYVCLLKKLPT